MRVRTYKLNMKASLDQIKSQKSGGGAGFAKLEPNTRMYVYVMPPWSEAGLLGKEAWECFGLPVSGEDKRARRHVAWKTHESKFPGMGMQDPVMNILNRVAEAAPNTQAGRIADKCRPNRPRYYVNIIPVATVKIDGNESDIESTYEQPEDFPSVKKLGLSFPAYNGLMSKIAESQKSGIDPTQPWTAVQYGISRTGEGKQTRYQVITVGVTKPGKGVVPTIDNLEEVFGESVLTNILNNLPNLDEEYPPPTETQKVEAEYKAEQLKKYFKGLLDKERGKVTEVEESPVVEAPTVDISAEAPTSPKITGADIMTKDLGLDEAPVKSDGTPVCLRRIHKVSRSPNSRWCKNCDFAAPCKVGAQALLAETKKSEDSE